MLVCQKLLNTMKMNNTYTPLVSVMMCCFNGEKYLNAAVDSLLSQTYEKWELVF